MVFFRAQVRCWTCSQQTIAKDPFFSWNSPGLENSHLNDRVDNSVFASSKSSANSATLGDQFTWTYPYGVLRIYGPQFILRWHENQEVPRSMTVILDIARNDGDSNNHPTMYLFVDIKENCEHNWQSVNLSRVSEHPKALCLHTAIRVFSKLEAWIQYLDVLGW